MDLGDPCQRRFTETALIQSILHDAAKPLTGIDCNSTRCYIKSKREPGGKTARVFKTAWFAKAARRARVKDDELCEAILEVMNGQCDDLGGGVYKKRLNKNMHRSIVLSKGGQRWVYEYIFAKKVRAKIEDDELNDFRKLAKAYSSLTEKQLSRLLGDKDLTEICDAGKAKI
jgi:hypothetical protein